MDEIEYSTVSAYSKLHEHKLSNDELKRSKDFLRTSTVRDYVQLKPKLREHIKRLHNESTMSY